MWGEEGICVGGGGYMCGGRRVHVWGEELYSSPRNKASATCVKVKCYLPRPMLRNALNKRNGSNHIT